jgi:hypothetical protein
MPLRLPLKGNWLLQGSLPLHRSLYSEQPTVSRASVNGNGTTERPFLSLSSTLRVYPMMSEQRSRGRFNILALYVLSILKHVHNSILTMSDRKRKSSFRVQSLMWSRPVPFLQSLPRQVLMMVIAPPRMTRTMPLSRPSILLFSIVRKTRP